MAKNLKNLQVMRRKAYSIQLEQCYYCGQPMWETDQKGFCSKFNISLKASKFFKCTAEHLIAKQDSGKNSADNIVAACLFCNRTRHLAKNPLNYNKYKTKVLTRMRLNKWHSSIFKNVNSEVI